MSIAGGLLDRCAALVWWLLAPLQALTHSLTLALLALALVMHFVPAALLPLVRLLQRGVRWQERERALAELREKHPDADSAAHREGLTAILQQYPLPVPARVLAAVVYFAWVALGWSVYLGLYRLLTTRPELSGVRLFGLWPSGERPPFYAVWIVGGVLAVAFLSQIFIAALAKRDSDASLLASVAALVVATFLPAGLVLYYLAMNAFIPTLFGVGLLIAVMTLRGRTRAARAPETSASG